MLEPHNQTTCYCCGGPHLSHTCQFKTEECNYCHKKGHIAKVCRAKKRLQQDKRKPDIKGTHKLTEDEDAKEYAMYHCQTEGSNSMVVNLLVNNAELAMEVDTGATLSIISEATYRSIWPKDRAPPLQASSKKLKTYTGEKITVKGSVEVDVTYQTQNAKLDLLIVEGNGPSLLGHDWLQHLRLDWTQLNQVRAISESKLQQMLDKHPQVFQNELGKVKGTTAKLFMDPEAVPKFFRARPVPYSLRDKVEQELDRLVRDGVIEAVQFSDWAAPIVPVVKKDGSVRICGDYKVTVNQVAKTDTYPLPRIEDLFASLTGGTSF